MTKNFRELRAQINADPERQKRVMILAQRIRVETKFGRTLEVGDEVCDCQFQHRRIVRFFDGDTVELEGGFYCSLTHCCDPVDHPWPHPEAK